MFDAAVDQEPFRERSFTGIDMREHAQVDDIQSGFLFSISTPILPKKE